MAAIVIWVVTVPVVAVYLWAVVGWRPLLARLAASVVLIAFWQGVLALADMDLAWRILMPLTVLVAMVSILLRSARRHPEPAADRS